VVIHDTVTIPPELKIAQKNVTSCVDTFYVNKMTFFHTILENYTIKHHNGLLDRPMYESFGRYAQAGFKSDYICADIEFEQVLLPMRDEFGFQVNLASAQEHVPTVECSIRTVKERIHTTIHGNPFISRVLIKAVVEYAPGS
jgi:hypothetical protein